jgi:alpha-glucosidase
MCLEKYKQHLLVTLVSLLIALPADSAEVSSPDGQIRFEIGVAERQEIAYSIRYGDEVIVGQSRLGLRFADHPGLDRGFRLAGERPSHSDTTWEQPWGESRFVRDHYNEILVSFESTEGPARRFDLRVRVYDDGIGFRYEVPAQDGYEGELRIVDEITEFRLPLEAKAWWIPGYAWNRYEFVYRESGIDEIELASTPMTLRLPSGVHLSLHEAALRNYAGYVLDQRRDGVFRTNLAPWSDGVRVRTRAPFATPWRTIEVSPDARGLLNSRLVLNLNEPNVLGDVSWVEPGKYVGIWWAMHLGLKTWGSGDRHGATTEETMRYIDFAAANGFDGVLVEGWNTGWDGDWFHNGAIFSFTETYADFDIKAVTDYAREKGVRLVGHHETSGHISNYEAQIADAFALYESVGVRQVKTGYVADGGDLRRVDENGVTHHEWHDGQFAVGHFERVLVEAAKRRISINTHEPVKDTGLRRTFPNWLSREGARGQEYNAGWSEPNPPEHTAMLTYTRMLAGPMDFTPGIFNLTHHGADSEFRVRTTLMHQLAEYVVLYSPIQMAADLPENYARFPDAFRFIRDVPTDWEESIALAGEVGEYVVFARRERGGDDWYLGAVSDGHARTVRVPLGFLDAGRAYTATIYRDGDDADWQTSPYDYVIEERDVDRAESIELKLAAGGGAAIRFSPVSETEQ